MLILAGATLAYIYCAASKNAQNLTWLPLTLAHISSINVDLRQLRTLAPLRTHKYITYYRADRSESSSRTDDCDHRSDSA